MLTSVPTEIPGQMQMLFGILFTEKSSNIIAKGFLRGMMKTTQVN